MKILESWLKKKKASLCIIAGICALSLFIINNSNEKIIKNTGGTYVVRFKHYGINAAEMERNVTIPLEDAFYSIPGIMSVQSSSENSLSNVFLRFKPGTQGRYEAVRDAAQIIYETLPSSVQRPEILSSNNSMIPVWSAAVITNSPEDKYYIAQILDKIIKPKLESLDGTGEVIVSGISQNEIYLIFDQEKLNHIGLSPSTVASSLAMNDSIFSGGAITQQNREILITIDGRYKDIDSLSKALIPLNDGNFIELSDIALIIQQEREPDILSRLNGKKSLGISVMGRHGADLRRLSSEIKKELLNLSNDNTLMPLEFIVLSDLGAEEASAFRSVFIAALSGAFMIALISFLLTRNNNSNYFGFFCALSIPIICLISAAVLTSIGFSVNRLLLTGIAAGIGTAVDAVIICSDRLRRCTNINSASFALPSLAKPLFAGAATTVAALIPLTFFENSEVKIIAYAIAIVTITAFIISLSFLPPLMLWGINSQKKHSNFLSIISIKKTSNIILKKIRKSFAFIIQFCCNYPILILFVCIAITVSAILMLLGKGIDNTNFSSEDSIYAQVEFNGGLLPEEIDYLLSNYSMQLTKITGLINIETRAKTGSGSLLISYNPKIIKAYQIRELAKQIKIPDGFIFFHENSVKDRYWQIFIYGDEDQKCRELSEELAKKCADYPLIREKILNFKQGSKKLSLFPRREIIAESMISYSTAANTARIGVYGPVAYKRINLNEETDVRIRTVNAEDFYHYAAGKTVSRQSKESTLGILVPAGNKEILSSIQLNSIMDLKEDTEPSSIRRDNRRRYASITISTKPMDARRVKKELSALLCNNNLPPGYSIEFDPEAIRQSENISSTVFSLILSIIFCFMILAAINESLSIPLIILSSIPPSLAIPAICLVLSGSSYNSAIACAFIVVSGMTVNAAVLCVDSIHTTLQSRKEKTILSIYIAIRRKMPALLATTITTIVGVIPFFFLSEDVNTLIRTLSFTGALGITGSLICSITIIPSLLFLPNNSSIKMVSLVRNKKLLWRNKC